MQAAGLETLHSSCTVSASEQAGKFRLRIEDEGCRGDDHCGNFNDDSIAVNRLAGFTLADLSRDGTQHTATLSAEAGTFTCAGTVHDGMLRGDSTFTPNVAFADRMNGMGFSGLDSQKLQAYTIFDIDSAWVESLKKAKIEGLNVDNLIAMRIFHIDPSYVSGITALGYDVPSADQLIGLKVQGVNADEVRQIRALGLKPSLDELVQIRIFHITPDFIRRMQERGLHDLTIAKLVQIKIFKLDE
jgi:hypothetical protein